MRLLILFLSLFLLVGCSSTNTGSTDKDNSDVIEETQTREITEEEQKYIDLILNKDYVTVMKQTESESNEVQQVYYDIATALNEYQVADNGGFDYSELIKKYSNVVRKLEEVKYIPDEIKEQVEEVRKSATGREEVYSNVTEKEQQQINTVNAQQQFEDDMNYRTRYPQPVSIGMTREEVLTEGWGRPKDINKTTTAYGVSEQWVYSGSRYLYFDDGILTSIQE